MFFRRSLAVALIGLAAMLACEGTNPAGPGSSTTTTTLATQPPAPTATPSPTATPTPAGNQNPAVDVRTSVTSFLRYGRLVKGRAATFIPGDVIYLTCTPLDKTGKPTKNHGTIRDWRITSDELSVGVDWVHTDLRTFNPDVHVSEQSHDGTIKARCEVNSDSGIPLVSGNTLMPIQRPQ
jgi:hypothetical protein